MEEILAEQHFIDLMLFLIICVPISTLLGAVFGRIMFTLIAFSGGILHTIFRTTFLLFIFSGILYLVLEWNYLSFEWAVLWGTFLVPIIAFYSYAVSLSNSVETEEWN